MAIRKGVLHAKFTDPLLGDKLAEDDVDDETEEEGEDAEEVRPLRPQPRPAAKSTSTVRKAKTTVRSSSSRPTLMDLALIARREQVRETAASTSEQDVEMSNVELGSETPTVQEPSIPQTPIPLSPMMQDANTPPPTTPPTTPPPSLQYPTGIDTEGSSSSRLPSNTPVQTYTRAGKRPPNSPPMEPVASRMRPRVALDRTLPERIEDTRAAPPPLDQNAQPKKSGRKTNAKTKQ